jgi:hypothetical protein
MNAGPGKTRSAMPINRTVVPTTETITRLTILIFSVLQIPDRRFIQDGDSIDRSFEAEGIMQLKSLLTIDSTGI